MDNLQLQKAFGLVVKRIRMKKGISQERLAELVDLHRTYISDIERGGRNVSLVNIYRIAEGLNVRTTDIFQGMEEELHETK